MRVYEYPLGPRFLRGVCLNFWYVKGMENYMGSWKINLVGGYLIVYLMACEGGIALSL